MISAVADYAAPVKPIVGILGGMGPSATADFLSKLTMHTMVDSESDHLPVAVWSNPEIPGRTQAILGRGPSPVPAMADGLRRLVSMGANAIAIPCNTAHAFLGELRADRCVEILNMIEAAVASVLVEYPGAHRIGILSTGGTRKAQLYTNECRRRSLDPVELAEVDQARLVDAAIRAVKTRSDLEVSRPESAKQRRCSPALARMSLSRVVPRSPWS
jgi:aspartate racemase